jgi:hypothetical protein
VTLDLANRRATAPSAFQARRGMLEASGVGLEVDNGREQATIRSGCLLQRPGERLRADRCLWNWRTQAVEADGPLELQLARNAQTTRGTRLRGQLGDDGAIEVSAPGSRVISRFRPRPSRPANPR